MARLGRAFPAAPIIRTQPASAGGGAIGDASIGLGAAMLSSAGTVGIACATAVTLGSATLSAAGTVALAGGAGITLNAVTSLATGVLAIVANASIELGVVRLSSNNSSAMRWLKRRIGIGISMHGN